MELRTAITSGKRLTNLQDPQEDPRAGIHESSKQNAQQVAESEKPNLVEGSGPSRTRKHRSDFVECSTSSKTEKETAD
jgi:hypothetical protein